VKILERLPVPAVFPVHPRTRARLQEYELLEAVESPGYVQLLPPQGYFEFLVQLKNCRAVMTDSGCAGRRLRTRR